MSEEQLELDVEDLTNPRHVNKRKRKAEEVRAQELDDMISVLNSPAGKRVLWRIMDKSGLMAPNMFTGNSATFHNIGKRDLGLWVYNEIMEANPQGFVNMMQAQLKQKDKSHG